MALAVRNRMMKKKMADGGKVEKPVMQEHLTHESPDMEEISIPMPRHDGLAQKIMAKKKMMAEGGMVSDLQSQEVDGDDFLTAEMPEQEYGDSDAFSEQPDEMEPKEKMRSKIRGIMQGLHSKHMGK